MKNSVAADYLLTRRKQEVSGFVKHLCVHVTQMTYKKLHPTQLVSK